MHDLQNIRMLLVKISRTQGETRADHISALQEILWEDDQELPDGLSDLAGTLNFYEPFEPDRDADLGYFGDDKLDELVAAAIEAIDSASAK